MRWENSIRDFRIHKFYCTVCKNSGIPIARYRHGLRQQGHKKRLYCVHCKKVTNHTEQRFY